MTTKICVHHWVVESPNGPFSLAKCKKCDKYDAVRNFFGETAWTQKEIKGTGVTNSEQARLTFLKEQMAKKREQTTIIKKRKSTSRSPLLQKTPHGGFTSKYADETKLQILLSLLSNPMLTEASKKYGVPVSTLHDWKKVYTDWNKVKAKGSTYIFKQLIKEKKKTENNVTKLAKEHNIPRRTLRNWLNDK